MKPRVTIYTDGSYLSSRDAGGYAALLEHDGNYAYVGGGEIETTNNRMELKAVIYGLDALIVPCDVLVYTDSQYTMFGFTKKWVHAWKRRKWKTATGADVKNQDLWQQLYDLVYNQGHTVKFKWVKGHAGNPGNEFCDQKAREYALSVT